MERRTFFKKLIAVAAAVMVDTVKAKTVKPVCLVPYDIGPHVTYLPPGWKMKQFKPVAAWPSDWEVFEQQPGSSKWVRIKAAVPASIPEQFIEA